MKTTNIPTAILTVLEATQMPLTAQDVGRMLKGLAPATPRNVNRHLLKLLDAGKVRREYTYEDRVGSYVYCLAAPLIPHCQPTETP